MAAQQAKNLISIHAPRRGSDLYLQEIREVLHEFQSTLPAGGATLRQAFQVQKLYISIHAPRRGSDGIY